MRVKLKDICEVKNGYAFKSSNYTSSGIRVIRITNVQKGFIEDENPEFYPISYKDELKEYMLKENDLLISLTGNVGRVALLSNSFLPAALNQRVGCIRVISDNIRIKYIYYMFQSQKFEHDCINSSNGIAQKNMSTEWLKEYELEIRNIVEQDNIINIFDKLTKIISNYKQQLVFLDTLIKARFVEMFGDVMQSKYELKTLQQIVNKRKDSIKRGPFGGSLKKDDFVNDGYLVYEQRHAIHNDFKYEKYYINKEKYNEMIGFKVEPGDLIISCSGVTLGRIAEIPNNAKKGIINQALLKISLDKKIMNNKFFIQQFRSKVIQEKLFGFSRGSGIPNMPSMEEVKKVKFICPPVELQEEYSRFVNEVDKLKFDVQKSLEKTQTLFDSLMQEYFG